jgi:flagellar basal body-associated protein FliL
VLLRRAKMARDGQGGKPGRTKLLLAVPLLLLVIAGALWFTGILPRMLDPGAAKGAAVAKQATDDAAAAAPVFAELPEIIANLDAGSGRTSFVKLQVRLQLAKASDQTVLAQDMPRVLRRAAPRAPTGCARNCWRASTSPSRPPACSTCSSPK